MDCEPEDPPTSIISPTDYSFSQVIFTNVQKFYPPKTDVHCKFQTENFSCSPKDWIGIFKVGWKTTREYFTWISARTSEDNTVLFTAYYLPKDDDYYQFCYVDYNGEVRGASTPFQFCHNIPEDENDILMVTTEIEMVKTNEENAELKKIVEKLTEESSVLREKVSSLQNENQAQAGRIQNLQEDLLNSTGTTQRLETENMELTVQTKSLEDEIEKINKTIQALAMDLQMQRNQEQKLISEIKEMEELLSNLQEEKKHFEKRQVSMATLQEQINKLESELKLYREKEQKFLLDREELKKALEKSESEKHRFQSINESKQKAVDTLTSTVNQCKEETVILKTELEFQACALEKEKKHKENLRQSLDKEVKKATDLQHIMKQNNEKLKGTEETITSLRKQVDALKAENETKVKQIGAMHITIATLEGEVKRKNDDCKSKMEAERIVRELRTQLKSAIEEKLCVERQLAKQQDLNRQQGEEAILLRGTLELREAEMQELAKNHPIGRVPTSSLPPNQGLIFGNPYEANYPSSLMEFGSTSSSTSTLLSSTLQCPVCNKTFMPHEVQMLEDHVMCHLE